MDLLIPTRGRDAHHPRASSQGAPSMCTVGCWRRGRWHGAQPINYNSQGDARYPVHHLLIGPGDKPWLPGLQRRPASGAHEVPLTGAGVEPGWPLALGAQQQHPGPVQCRVCWFALVRRLVQGIEARFDRSPWCRAHLSFCLWTPYGRSPCTPQPAQDLNSLDGGIVFITSYM